MNEIINLIDKTKNITLNSYEFEHLKNEQDKILKSIYENLMIETGVKNKINNLKELKSKINIDNISNVNLKPVKKNLKKDITKVVNEEIDKRVKEKEKKNREEIKDSFQNNIDEINKKYKKLEASKNKLEKLLKNINVNKIIENDIDNIKGKEINMNEIIKKKENSIKTKKSLTKKKTTLKKKLTKKKPKKFMIVNNNPPYREYYFFQKK